MALQVLFLVVRLALSSLQASIRFVMQFSGFDDYHIILDFSTGKTYFLQFLIVYLEPISSTLPKSNANYRQILQLTELLAHLAQ